MKGRTRGAEETTPIKNASLNPGKKFSYMDARMKIDRSHHRAMNIRDSTVSGISTSHTREYADAYVKCFRSGNWGAFNKAMRLYLKRLRAAKPEDKWRDYAQCHVAGREMFDQVIEALEKTDALFAGGYVNMIRSRSATSVKWYEIKNALATAKKLKGLW